MVHPERFELLTLWLVAINFLLIQVTCEPNGRCKCTRCTQRSCAGPN